MHYHNSNNNINLRSPGIPHRVPLESVATTNTSNMGLNIPMLIANSQTLDSWNTAGQYSPPISGSGGGGSERGGSGGGGGVPPQQLRVPLPMSYHGGAGGSSSSDFQQSPLKTMDTSDNEDNNNTKEDVAAAAALGQLAAKVELRSPSRGGNGGGGGPGGGGGSSSSREPNDPVASEAIKSDRTLSEAGSSPIPNTNMHEAHKNHLLNSPAGGRAVTPRQAHEQMQMHHHQQQQHQHHVTQQLHHGHDELDIKQELVDYFHGQAVAVGNPAPPPPPESHRSYSSAGEESRLQLVDMAQDLRVAQAKANFGAFVLPPRGSDASNTPATTVAMPLNMRKLSGAASAGHMLMNSLLGSRESMSDGEDPDPDADNDEATESANSPGRNIKSSVSAQAAVAASAFYADSLNRDDCDFIGSNVSLKLRTMDRTQRIIAEKLISEVLYYGQFNELERSARIQPK
ncbi:knirps-related protein isoform X2 [Drosophila takahashii]|uniref:knirps-related protein isoform X2 n=1 Tax=Drosophila takahashii TaxID=29030 RepID=UPI001CF8E247|nr:uncharacterized protein LOC108068793 isoform X2 [Drosophila takahashii]